MKSSIKMVAFGLLLGGWWTISGVKADDLPDMGENSQGQAQLHESAADYVKADAVCTKCHDESEVKPILSIFATKHGVKGDPRTPTCQACHGASEAHVKNAEGKSTRPAPDVRFGTKRGSTGSYPVSEPKVQNAACLSCHDKNLNRTHWEGSAHQVNDLVCASCHELHTLHDKVRDKQTQPEVCFTCHKEQRAQSKKISHHAIGESKVVCADCHNPHGSSGPKLLKKNTVNETCFICHAEKRGPLTFEHQPVMEDCTICHTPHGSNITPLLKSRPPFLCQECHDGPHASTAPVGPNAAGKQAGLSVSPSANNVGSACMNCHVKVHGSNSPAGGYFQR
jgi:DmsE family decaheme c-type cytochrome